MTAQQDHHIIVERQVIYLMLKHRSATEEMFNDNMTSEFFDPCHGLIVDSIYDEFVSSDYKRSLTREGYIQCLRQSKVGGELINNLTVYDKCILAYAKPDDLGHLKKQLVENYVARKSHAAIQKFRDDAKKEGWVYAARTLNEKLLDIVALSNTKRATAFDLHEVKEEFIKDIQNRKEHPDVVVTCGIPEIDDAIYIGFRPQHMTLFVGDVGSHKSNMMLNIALGIYDKGFSVLFVPLEMGLLDIMARIVANRADVNGNKLARPSLLNEEEIQRIAECNVWLKKNNRFLLLDAPDRLTVHALEMELEKRAKSFAPQVVVIDYIANLRCDIRFANRNDLEIGETLKSLRFLGKKYGFHIISAAQMGREALRAMRQNPDVIPDSTSIRGSHEYAADADFIFGILKNADEPERLKIIKIKARSSESGGSSVELRVNPPYYRITSTRDAILAGGVDDFESELNHSPSEILERQENSPSIQFTGSFDLDDDLDLG